MRTLLFFFLIVTVLFTPAQSTHTEIKSQLKLLEELIGEWSITTENISHSGIRSEETSTYAIYWALDSTYIVREGSLTNSASNRTRSFISWLTYDTERQKFKMVFFYDRRSTQIIEYGSIEDSMKFVTYTSFVIGNGVTEHIGHVLDLRNPDLIDSRAWIRLDNAEEANTFSAVWARKH